MIRREPRRRRFGFTLVELLVVIVIIGILIGLLLPVIIAAVRKANDARIAAEIQTLASALAKFKNHYGEYPPSRVILSEQGCYSVANSGAAANGSFIPPVPGRLCDDPGGRLDTGTATSPRPSAPDISFGTLAERSLRYIRKMFPRVVAPNASFSYWHDFNGNGVLDPGFMYLEGHECLVFFLGGIPNPTLNSGGAIVYGTSGFGRNPQFPFSNPGTQGSMSNASAAIMLSTNRTQPQYEFNGSRLLDDDLDGIPGYLDPLGSGNSGTYYAYFASYGASGYDPNDVNFGDG